MKFVNFLIKPASSLCNMRCRYCFYADEAALREAASAGVMSGGTAEALLRAAFEAVDEGGAVSFAFQGGEPTLAGLDFFRGFAARAEALNRKRAQISYAIQTNGLAIDADWAAFLAERRFLVGLSLDGDKAVHDEFRVDAAGRGTWNRVTRSLALLQRAGAEVNALCVVTRRCARMAQRAYNNLKRLGLRHMQFIACLDPLEAGRGGEAYSLTPELYGEFLCSLFDAWYRDWKSGNYVSVRLFDDYVHLAMGFPAGTCATAGACGGCFVAEGDGTLYPCDFYCLDEWRLGHVGGAPLESLWLDGAGRRFLENSSRRPAECESCRWRRLCNGGCQRDRYVSDGVHNYYCEAFKRLFDYAGGRIAEIAAAERRYLAGR